jgi:hypothetical protein
MNLLNASMMMMMMVWNDIVTVTMVREHRPIPSVAIVDWDVRVEYVVSDMLLHTYDVVHNAPSNVSYGVNFPIWDLPIIPWWTIVQFVPSGKKKTSVRRMYHRP